MPELPHGQIPAQDATHTTREALMKHPRGTTDVQNPPAPVPKDMRPEDHDMRAEVERLRWPSAAQQ